MKKILTALLCLMLALCAVARAEETVPYSAVYTSQNPVPEIARRVRPAVVQVVSKRVDWSKQTGEVRQDLGYGSGVYFDERGYVMTNYHVVKDADELEIVLLDGRKLPAVMVGGDGGNDVAVIRFEGDIGAQPVVLGDSDALEIGELTIAIGNPGSSSNVLFGTVTAGIVSGLEREDMNAGNFTRSVKMIQTDAAINTGNSGGALLNAKGEMIGMPTLKIMWDPTTVYEGLGFAVPVNTIKPLIAQLIDTGKVTRPRIGASVITHEGPENPLRGYAPAGVQVVDVEQGGPAFKAGVLKYDVIMEIDGLRVTEYRQLTEEIDKHQSGDKVTLKICRFYNPASGEPLGSYTITDVTVELEMLA